MVPLVFAFLYGKIFRRSSSILPTLSCSQDKHEDVCKATEAQVSLEQAALLVLFEEELSLVNASVKICVQHPDK